jgi:hypothetical protein
MSNQLLPQNYGREGGEDQGKRAEILSVGQLEVMRNKQEKCW